MNKGHQTTTRTDAWRFVDESRPFVFQFREGCVYIRNFNRDMVHSRSAPGEKLSHRRVRVQRLEQFDVSIADCQHTHLDALFRDFFGRIDFQAKCISPNRQTLFDALSGDSDVINFEQPE